MKEFVEKIANFIRDIPQTPRLIVIFLCAAIICFCFIGFFKKSYGKEKIALKISTIVIVALCAGIIALLATLR